MGDHLYQVGDWGGTPAPSWGVGSLHPMPCVIVLFTTLGTQYEGGGGHQGIGSKKPTVIRFKNPTSPLFRVGWHALLIRVKKITVLEFLALLCGQWAQFLLSLINNIHFLLTWK